MSRFAHSNDPNLVLPEPASKTAPGDPPSPWELPKFEPLRVPKTSGTPNLPPSTSRDNPTAIFRLIFTDKVIQYIVDRTNDNMRLLESLQTVDPALEPHRRKGAFVTTAEMNGYNGVTIYIGCHPEANIEAFWNTNKELGAIHQKVQDCMSLRRWQLDRSLPPHS